MELSGAAPVPPSWPEMTTTSAWAFATPAATVPTPFSETSFTEIRAAAEELKAKYESIVLIANSIGAYFSMCAGVGHLLRKAYFISPIVDMERLITDMMQWANVTEAELKSKGVIHTAFGEDLSWEYLCYVRNHPIDWKVPTSILYGSCDNLTSFETISNFAEKHSATLTVMEGGEHWFHTEAQMRFLDEWIRSCEGGDLCSH